jgi:hypothetical protein
MNGGQGAKGKEISVKAGKNDVNQDGEGKS